MIKLVIFDWAGTTVDFGSMAPVRAMQAAFESYQLPITIDEIRQPMGKLKKDHIRDLLALPTVQSAFQKIHHQSSDEQTVDDLLTIFTEKLLIDLAHTKLKPDTLSTIKKLRKQGVLIGSTTGYTTPMLQLVAKISKEAGYQPDFMITPDDVDGIGRPAANMIVKNMQHFGINDPNEVLKIGDTVVDILEGKNAGVISVGITTGSSLIGLDEDEWANLTPTDRKSKQQEAQNIYFQNGADAVIDQLDDLVDLIGEVSD